MTSRDRLIELIDEAVIGRGAYLKDGRLIDVCGEKSVDKITAIALADYLLENGVIIPPCKVGDTVYIITTKQPCYACNYCTDFCHKSCRIDDKAKKVVKRARVCAIELGAINKIHTEIEKTKIASAYKYTCWFEDFGETVFPTIEEAEQALKGGVQE